MELGTESSSFSRANMAQVFKEMGGGRERDSLCSVVCACVCVRLYISQGRAGSEWVRDQSRGGGAGATERTRGREEERAR